MRNTISLSGEWQFQLDAEGKLSPSSLAPDREITVPMPWQAAFPQLAEYSGYAWYRREVEISEEWLRGQLLLRFGAVDYWCRVFVNGNAAGEHEGGYTPFEIPIQAFAHAGTNEIAVEVYDSAQESLPIRRWPHMAEQTDSEGPPFNAQDIPHGKQEWYINVGGIWQDVELLALPPTYISRLQVTADIQTGEVQALVELAGQKVDGEGGALRLVIAGEDEGRAAIEIALAPGRDRYEASLHVSKPQLWNPEDPHLYTLRATLSAPDGDDELTTRFGFREISTSGGKLLLNGQPLFLLCALDQDLYPDTIYTVPSEEFLRDQFEKAKHLGLNTLRCHIKPPDPRYLDLADEMGLLVWAEIPSWRTFHYRPTLHPSQVPLEDAIKRRVERTLEEMIRRDYNHASLIIWTIVNEDWGTSLPLCAEDREWVATMYGRCKQLDPTRLVVDNSACPHPWGPNIHVQSDLDDFHIYANIPGQARGFERTIEQFALRPLWTYSSHGDAKRTGQEPLVLSEFGNWGLPSLRALREHYGQDPRWFEIGAWWSPWEGEATWAGRVEDRFRALGMDSVWQDYEAFAASTQWHQYDAMKFEIETMRRQPSLAGYVITEFTDAYWESNGLLDFARNPKAYHDSFAAINSPDVIMARAERYAAWDDERLPVRLFAAHYSASPWDGAVLRWKVEGSDSRGEHAVGEFGRGEVRGLGTLRLKFPAVKQTQPVRVSLAVVDREAGELARNSIEILVIPSAMRRASYDGPVAVISRGAHHAPEHIELSGNVQEEAAGGGQESPLGVDAPTSTGDPADTGKPGLHRLMSAHGYRVTTELRQGTHLAVTDYPDAELLRWVRGGGALLFICEGPSPFFWAQPRTGAYSGSWITSFSWLRDNAHRRLKARNPLGMPFVDIMPSNTILGLPVEDARYQGDYLSEMVSGWVHHPSVHTVQFRYGKGRVIMTTFSIEKGLMRSDPVSLAMLHDLIEYLASDDCRPTLEANF